MKTRATWIQVLFAAIAAALIVASCATPIPPSGGPKDATPPKLDTLASTPDKQTNFVKADIYLAFDEWVQLNDPFNQIVISPPLNFLPQIKLKGQGVLFQFDPNEILRENTTYTINFGSAIKDLTEGNIVENFSFVFATGAYIDSLSVRGRIMNASSGEPEPEVLLILQDNLTDTAIQKLRPAYFAKSDESGNFKINNIRNDTFQAFALKDLNLNYLFDQEGEWIGFLDSFLLVNAVTGPSLELTIFEPENLYVNEVIERAGDIRIALSKALPIENLVFSAGAPEIQWRQDLDTVRIWYTSPDTTSWTLFVHVDAEQTDTLEIDPVPPAFRQDLMIEKSNAARTRKLHPEDALEIQFRAPVESFDETQISIIESDSLEIADLRIAIDSQNQSALKINFRVTAGAIYEIVFLPGAVTTILGHTNDTLNHVFTVGESKDFGNILITTTGLDDTMQYLLQLLDKEIVIEERVLDSTSVDKITFAHLAPATYSLRMIEDRNKNGRWDTGRLLTKRQPEKLLIKELEALRAGWDLEIALNWNLN